MKSTTIGKYVLRFALPALLVTYATVHRLGKTYGSTVLEQQADMPGDDIVPRRNS